MMEIQVQGDEVNRFARRRSPSIYDEGRVPGQFHGTTCVIRTINSPTADGSRRTCHLGRLPSHAATCDARQMVACCDLVIDQRACRSPERRSSHVTRRCPVSCLVLWAEYHAVHRVCPDPAPTEHLTILGSQPGPIFVSVWQGRRLAEKRNIWCKTQSHSLGSRCWSCSPITAYCCDTVHFDPGLVAIESRSESHASRLDRPQLRPKLRICPR